jgi:hypothetical protein
MSMLRETAETEAALIILAKNALRRLLRTLLSCLRPRTIVAVFQ